MDKTVQILYGFIVVRILLLYLSTNITANIMSQIYTERVLINGEEPPVLKNTIFLFIIIDGILGTGINGDIREPYASAINFINQTDCYKFAVDVPSGMDPQTGETASLFTKCDMTVTFHKMKQGIPKRKDLTGELFAEKIGIPPEAEIDVL